MSTSPTDRANLAPVDIGNVRAFTTYIRGAFNVKYTDTVGEARGVGTGLDLNPRLGVGYYNRQGQMQRGAAAGNSYDQGKRGHMPRIPTAQKLIQAITGIGDPTQGR